MAFVKITNGTDMIEVQEGAFNSIYKGLGFSKIKNAEKKANEDAGETKGEEEVKSEDDKFLAAIVEKPLASWSKDEVKKFTELKNIDTTGASKLSEVKDIIKEYI